MNIKAGNGTLGGNYMSQTYVSGNPKLTQILTRLFEDTVSLLDLTNRFTSMKAFVENIILSEAQTVKKIFLIILNDIIVLNEGFSTGLHEFFSQLFVDTVNLTEGWSRKLDKLVSFVDSFSITDLTRRLLPSKLFTDAVNLADTMSRSIGKRFTELVAMTDTLFKNIIKELLESINITDSINTYKIKIRTFIDGILLSDTGSVVQTLKRILTDTVHFSDSLFKSIGRSLTDAIALVDIKLLQPIKNFTDSIHLSESIVKSVNILVSDTIELVEDIVKRLNGMIINWSKTTVAVGVWAKRTRDEIATTKIGRALVDWTKRRRDEVAATKVSKEEKEWTKFKGINDHE